MTSLSISKAWDETREIFRRDGKLLATLAAALFLLPQTIAGVVTGQGDSMADGPSYGLLMLVAAIIGIIGQLAIAWLALGRGATVGESIRHAFARALPFLGAMLIVMIGIFLLGMIIGMILLATGVIEPAGTQVSTGDAMTLLALLAIPGIYISVRLAPTVTVAANEKLGPIGILKRSWTLTRGHFARLLGFLAIFLIAVIIVAAALGAIGGLVVRVVFGDAEPFTMGALVLALLNGLMQAGLILVYVVMLTRIYLQLTDGRDGEVTVPHSGG